MIIYKTTDEIELIRKSSLLVSDTLAYLAGILRPGMTTLQLDALAEEYIRDHGAIPSFKGYNGFTGTLCTSINDVVVHGIPSDLEVKEGDVVSLDCGVVMHGFHGDSAYSFLVGEVSEDVVRLAEVTKRALYLGIDAAEAGNRIGDIGFAIQQYAEREHGYGIVRELVGHGIGRELHEEPDVPNFGSRGKGIKLQEGLVIAIEPMVNMGSARVAQESDGWTIRTRDKKVSMHFEHTIAVRRGKADVLSGFEVIEQAELKNENLYKSKEQITH